MVLCVILSQSSSLSPSFMPPSTNEWIISAFSFQAAKHGEAVEGYA